MGIEKGIKMSFRNQLKRLGACDESLEWVENKTIEQAWLTYENPEWMLWILIKTDLDLTDPVCDMAELVLHLVPEECQLACIWALDAAKRRASKDELKAASDAAYDASASLITCIGSSAAAAAAAAYYAAAAAYVFSAASLFDSDARTRYITDRAAYVCVAAGYNAGTTEQKKQCDILRKYFTIDQVKEAFNKLVVKGY